MYGAGNGSPCADGAAHPNNGVGMIAFTTATYEPDEPPPPPPDPWELIQTITDDPTDVGAQHSPVPKAPRMLGSALLGS